MKRSPCICIDIWKRTRRRFRLAANRAHRPLEHEPRRAQLAADETGLLPEGVADRPRPRQIPPRTLLPARRALIASRLDAFLRPGCRVPAVCDLSCRGFHVSSTFGLGFFFCCETLLPIPFFRQFSIQPSGCVLSENNASSVWSWYIAGWIHYANSKFCNACLNW